MSRLTGWAIGAAIMSITVGVLIGLVLHAGQVQQAEKADAAAASAVLTPESSAVSAPALGGAASSTFGGPSVTLAEGRQPIAPSPAPRAESSGITPAADTVTSPGSITTGLPLTSTTSPTPATPTTPSTQASSGGSSPTAGGDCPALAQKATADDGTTLYCQMDQRERVLRWRAVTDGGGCLNQKMTGIGVDGRSYECRLDSSGLNHWASTA